MKTVYRHSTPNIYDYLDPLPCSEHAFDDAQTSAAIKSMLVEERRESSKRALPDLLPTETADTAVDPEDTPETQVADEPQPAEEPKSFDLAQHLPNRRSMTIGMAMVLFALVFPQVVLSVFAMAVIFVFVLMAIFGPEAVIASIAPAYSARDGIRKLMSQMAFNARQRFALAAR